MPSIDRVFELFEEVGVSYRSDKFDLDVFPPLVSACYAILEAEATTAHYADVRRVKMRGTKTYWSKPYSVFISKADPDNISRPYRSSNFISHYSDWEEAWKNMVDSIDRPARKLSYRDTDRVIYSASMTFFAVIDILSPGSRQTNGTFLERLLGTLLVLVTGYPLKRGGVTIAAAQALVDGESTGSGNEGSVPTDIVLDPGEGRYKLVFPVKISTRERIGQVFTQQRILDTSFPGTYRSALLCVSETQLLKRKRGAKETCLPKQVNFLEKYIAHVDALYYLDPPFAYIDDAITVPVRRISDLFDQDLAAISEAVELEREESCGDELSVVTCNLPAGHRGEHQFRPARGVQIPSPKLRLGQVSDTR